MTAPKGSLIVVSTGMKLAQQCTPEARFAMEQADILFAAGSDYIAQQWLETLNANTVHLQGFYGGGRTRIETYEAMSEAILSSVRAGKQTCAAFYGHAGVFVTPSHQAIARARKEGFEARMLPGVSAEDCLFADLGIDPGALGCQSYEATDFIVHARKIDPTAALILWQIAVAGDLTYRKFDADPRRLAVLVEVLKETYPSDHRVVLYEAAMLPVSEPVIEAMPLCELASARVSQSSSLYVPPALTLRASPERLRLLGARLQPSVEE